MHSIQPHGIDPIIPPKVSPTDGLTREGARDTCVPKKFLLNDNIQDFQHAKYFRGWANKESSG